MLLYTAPEVETEIVGKKIFLAGSIDQGSAINWQAKMVDLLKPYNVTVFNPRRESMNNGFCDGKTDDPEFVEQVNWELKNLERADIIFFHFAPNSKSPITLLELGIAAKSEYHKVIVYCPNDFYRQGNVEIVSERYDCNFFTNEQEAIDYLLNFIKD